MSRGKKIWRTARFLTLIALVALVMAGCEEPTMSVLDPKGTVAEKQLGLIQLSVYIMTLVCVVVIGIFVYVLIRFRAKPGDNSIPEQVEGNTKLEILWTVIPIILLAIFAVPTVQKTFSLAEEAPENGDALRVKVTAHQYWWEFEYPDLDITTAQEMVIPTGERVYLELESKDVVHSFWVPKLAGKQDLIPGRTNTMWLDAHEPGVYKGRCAELCGASHALMNFEVIAQEPQEFEQWVEERQNPSSEPQNAQEAAGKEVFTQNCMSCHAIDGTDLKTSGDQGPNLAGFGNREKIAGLLEFNDENLEEWLKHPEEIKPGTYMPSFDYLSDEDMDNLKEYLKSLQ
ncbi:cytochrome c oxidase subunit II [Desmospora profundinema]|uniref:Cytochrome c oxidase subunit 2 n=1 Tax=Desmospora profundinema TaxID=1571184 RepID=A0ABU1IM33_9BACL|nr:cytochrome c oxidase subunit II [Desmospora profundinema]MDR6225841.1 cytochrome c oxidase subunit 2 [Desmospora profundinema]